MPPRKSNVSAVSAEEGGAGTPAKESGTGVEEYNLPRTMIQRLSKGVLPPNTQIQKDALLAISKSATVFVNYLTAHANESAQRANKKTIQPKDVMDAIAEIEFEHFLPRLEGELTKYNAVQCDKRNTYRRKIRDEQKAKSGGNPADPSNPTAEPAAAGANEATHEYDDSTMSMHSPTAHANGVNRENGDEPPASKKMRRENGDISDADEASGDEGMEEEADVADEEGSEDEDEEEEGGEDGFESAKEELGEDALEEREKGGLEDDVMDDGDDSD